SALRRLRSAEPSARDGRPAGGELAVEREGLAVGASHRLDVPGAAFGVPEVEEELWILRAEPERATRERKRGPAFACPREGPGERVVAVDRRSRGTRATGELDGLE